LFGGKSGLPRFTISNQEYPKGLEGLGGFDFPPLGSDGCPTKIMSTSLGIFVCTLIRYVPLGVYGLNLIQARVWVDVVNGTLIIITIE
jgi:hypothetical protein